MGNGNSAGMGNKKAEITTRAIVNDLEATIAGSPAVAVLMINSALAAVEVLIHRYEIRKEIIAETYQEAWEETVDGILKDPTIPTAIPRWAAE